LEKHNIVNEVLCHVYPTLFFPLAYFLLISLSLAYFFPAFYTLSLPFCSLLLIPYFVPLSASIILSIASAYYFLLLSLLLFSQHFFPVDTPPFFMICLDSLLRAKRARSARPSVERSEARERRSEATERI